MAVGIMSISSYNTSTATCFEGLFEKLGIEMTPDIQHYLQVKATNQNNRIEKTKTKEFKKKRKAGEYSTLKIEVEEAKKSCAKRDGTYQPGIGLLQSRCTIWKKKTLNQLQLLTLARII